MENRLPVRISLGLILAVFAAYFPVMNATFLNFDDPEYIYSNPHVNTGLTRSNIVWAWTTFQAANWHPLTWMWHQLDCQLFDLRPRSHHLVNLGWHIANTVCLYLVLRRMTGEDWRPALVAALFGLHPLHVESVAWLSERKDVTSTFFALFTLGVYTLYSERPSLGRYVLVLVPFILGLLCKPMLVTWPFVLLLMDYWPLRRTPLLAPDTSGESPRFATAGWIRLVLEKLPLLALAIASSLVTMLAQSMAMKPSERLSIWFRLGNAVSAYAMYLRKMVWPMDLAAFYRHLGSRLPLTPVVVSAVVLVLISLVVFLGYRRRPALLVGWLWYLGTLVPVVGLVQVGLQSMADRYSYIPLIGVFLALAWCIPSLPEGRPAIKTLTGLGLTVVVVLCAMLTFRQARFWRNSEVLWGRALQVDDNPITHCSYAGALYNLAGEVYEEAEELRRRGRIAEAERRAADAKYLLDETERHCRLAIEMEPTLDYARAKLGEHQIFRGDLDGALATFSEAVARSPEASGLRDRLGRVLAYLGRNEEACEQFRQACRIDPESSVLHLDLGTALARLGDRKEAEREWALGLRLEPDSTEKMREFAESFLGRRDVRRYCPAAGVFHAQEACWAGREPQAELYQTLAQAYEVAGQPVAAYYTAQQALTLAKTDGHTELVSALQRLTQTYESLARKQEARVAVLTLVGPMSGTFPGVLGTVAVLQVE